MGKVILLRHGETDWNRADRIQGWTDVPLNSRGVQQADRAAKKLSKFRLAAVYSSPLQRALRTAARAAEKQGLQVIPVREFMEVNQGLWEGLLVEEAKKQFPALYKKWQEAPCDAAPPGGESIEMLSERVLPAYDDIKKKHRGDVICIVTHKVVMALIKCAHKKIPLQKVLAGLPENAEWEILDNHENRNHTLQLSSGGGGS